MENVLQVSPAYMDRSIYKQPGNRLVFAVSPEGEVTLGDRLTFDDLAGLETTYLVGLREIINEVLRLRRAGA